MEDLIQIDWKKLKEESIYRSSRLKEINGDIFVTKKRIPKGILFQPLDYQSKENFLDALYTEESRLMELLIYFSCYSLGKYKYNMKGHLCLKQDKLTFR